MKVKIKKNKTAIIQKLTKKKRRKKKKKKVFLRVVLKSIKKI
jgi:hypothetical protein